VGSAKAKACREEGRQHILGSQDRLVRLECRYDDILGCTQALLS
jgi:hypothetical protein